MAPPRQDNSGVALYDAFDDHRGHKVVLDKTSGLTNPGQGVMLYCEACEETVLWTGSPNMGTEYHFPIDKTTGEIMKISGFVYAPGSTQAEIENSGGDASGATTTPASGFPRISGVHPVGTEVVILSPHIRPKYLNGVYGKVAIAPASPSGIYEVEVDAELLKADPRIASKTSGSGTRVRVRGSAVRALA